MSGQSHVANGTWKTYWCFDGTGATAETIRTVHPRTFRPRGFITVLNDAHGNNCAFLTGNGASILLGQISTSCANAAASSNTSVTYSSANNAYTLNNALASSAGFSIGGLRSSTAN